MVILGDSVLCRWDLMRYGASRLDFVSFGADLCECARFDVVRCGSEKCGSLCVLRACVAGDRIYICSRQNMLCVNDLAALVAKSFTHCYFAGNEY